MLMSGHSRLRSSLRLSITLSPEYSVAKPYNVTPDSSSPASGPGSLSTDSISDSIPSSRSSDWRICSVLCLHDYASDDPTHLSFSANEILEIVRQEDSGWWAALRLPENHVGWISSAFVEPLSEELADRLRHVPPPLRILEYDAEQNLSPNSAHMAEGLDPMSPPLETLHSQGNLFPDVKNTPTAPAIRGQVTHDEGSVPGGPVVDSLPIHTSSVRPNPTRINTPVTDSELDSRWCSSPTTPLQRRNRSLSDPASPGSSPPFLYPEPLAPHTRSQSQRVPHRHRRRRPLLLDDSSSLSRLSTLIESHNTAEIDVLAYNRMEYMDAFSRIAMKSPPPETVGMQSPMLKRDGSLSREASPFSVRSQSPRSMPPWLMRPSYNENNIKLGYDGTVKAATLPALVERLTLDYLKTSEENKLRHTFLTTFRTFASADLVFDLIKGRYRLQIPQNITPKASEEWKEKKLRPTQHRVLTILTMWMEDHNMAREEPHIAQRLKEFLQSIHEPQSLALTAKLMLQALDRLTSTMPLPSIPITPVATPKRWRHKAPVTELVRMDVAELARQLCLLEHRLYAKIRVQDCWVWTHTANALADFWSTQEKLVTWVKSSLLSVEGVRKKAEMMDFWIHCAEKCKAMNNISSMNGIVTAISSKVNASQDPTWSQIHRKASLDALVKLSDATDNFIAYKTLLKSIDGPCVPFIGMYLVDISRINQEYPDRVPSNDVDLVPTLLINFTKRQKWAETIQPMLRFQSRPYNFAEVSYTMNFIESNLVSHDPELLPCERF